jgi:hypothetical protein
MFKMEKLANKIVQQKKAVNILSGIPKQKYVNCLTIKTKLAIKSLAQNFQALIHARTN